MVFFEITQKHLPLNDFADSLAGYRVYPKILQTTSPLKFQYFKERIFNGRDYTHQGNEEYYTSKISSLVQSQTQKWIPTCINTTDQVKENLSPLIFSQVTYNKFLKKGLLATHIRCLETKMQQEIKQLENQLKYNEFEACSFFANNERNWWHSIIQNHSDFFIAVLNDIDPKHIRNIDIVKFRNQIKKEFRSKGTAIHCHQNSATPSKCFTDHLKKHIKDVAKKHFYFNEDIISNELRRFYSLYSYSKTLQEVIHSTKHILQVTHSDIENTANKLVSYCSTQNQLNHSTKLIEPYKGPDGFFILETWFMNCININLKDYLKTLTINKKQNLIIPLRLLWSLSIKFIIMIYYQKSIDLYMTLLVHNMMISNRHIVILKKKLSSTLIITQTGIKNIQMMRAFLTLA